MSDEVSTSTTQSVKKMSDGSVNVSLEKYEELLAAAAEKAPVINKTTVIKTAEILSQEHRAWGTTFMGLGAAFFVVGAIRYRAGRTAS